MNWIKCKDAMPDRKMHIMQCGHDGFVAYFSKKGVVKNKAYITVFDFDPEQVSWDGWLQACNDGNITHWCEVTRPERK